MNTTKLNCSMNHTAELRKLILENPEFPLLVFCGEESWSGEYGYEQADVNNVAIKELALYEDYWLDKEDYKETLANDYLLEKECEDLSDKEYDKMIEQKVEEIEFVKVIVIYVG